MLTPASRGEFDAGNVALDLLNTRATRDGEVTDDLSSPAALRAWIDDLGLSSAWMPDPLSSLTTARTLLGEARQLRDDVERLVLACQEGEPVPRIVLFALDRILATSRVSLSLRSDSADPRLVEVEKSREPLARLAPVAKAAVALLLTHDAARIRRCASPTCTRWFLDTSKGGRRKWCSMATCGNRAKAAKHRRRLASA